MSATQVSFVEFALSRCPWCGALGPDFDESPMPSDYCGHDPAEVESTPSDAPALGHTQAGGLVAQSAGIGGECPAVDKYDQVVEPGQFVSWYDQRYRVLEVEGDRCLVVGDPVPGQRYADYAKGWLRCSQICVEY